MKKIKRWVYYCDFCKKSNRSASSIKTHEKHCCGNPDRECRICTGMEWAQKSTAELVELAEMVTLDELKKAVDGCPPCVLAALLQWRKKFADSLEFPTTDTPGESWNNWDFKAEMSAAYSEMCDRMNEQRRDWM